VDLDEAAAVAVVPGVVAPVAVVPGVVAPVAVVPVVPVVPGVVAPGATGGRDTGIGPSVTSPRRTAIAAA